MKKRMIALVLAFVLLLLPACGNKKPAVQTPVQPTPGEIFADKAAYTESLDSFHRELEITAKKSVGIYEYEEEEEISEDFANRKTDNPISRVENDSSIGDESYKIEEQYLDGKLYLTVNKTDYVVDVAFAEYEEAQYPLVLLDPANYQTVTYDEKAGTFQFKDATALESWMVPEYAKLLSAEGTAKLDSAGNIAETTYTASYVQGPMTVEVTYTSQIEETDLTAEDLSVEESAKTVSHMYIPLLMARTEAALELEAPLSAQCNCTVLSYALGCYYSEFIDMDIYEQGDTQLAKMSDDIRVQEASGTTEVKQEVTFKDGKFTVTMDGESVESDGDFDDLTDAIWETMSTMMPIVLGGENLLDAKLTAVGDFWLVEQSFDESLAESMQAAILTILTGDPYILDDYVEDVRVDADEAWFSVDMDTLLPVSVGLSVEITQTIEGEEYILSIEFVENLEFGDPDAYENIMEVPFPDEEPEVKPTPAFYEVTDDKGGKMYLLGTIHIGDDATAYLPTAITDALEASDALALEVNVETVEDRLDTDEKLLESYRKGVFYEDGSLTADHLDEETAKKLDQMIKAYGKQTNMEYALPSVVAGQFSNSALDFNNGLYTSKGVEHRLLNIAEEHAIEILEVEDVYESVSMESRYSETTQKYMLESALETYRAAEMEGSWELYNAWCRGDETELREMLSEEDEEDMADATEEELAAYEEYKRIMVTERDACMVEKAKEYVSSGKTVFMAVGTAHVLGEDGIVDSLRAAGYTVTKVEY